MLVEGHEMMSCTNSLPVTHPVAILSVNSIIDALDKSGNLDCSSV